jgi:hypothetical protein
MFPAAFATPLKESAIRATAETASRKRSRDTGSSP